ncbi:hypothetical protein ANO14919_025850 [Xylariales sp. No.14919]|nr:hypothetical protein ANO14919_025850 [Xylariales sp. No.14919]
MTERRLIESAIGLAGRLSHIPYGTDKPEDCGWRTSRAFTPNAPVFRALGLYKTWISPEADHVADLLSLPGTAWEQSRRQQRWLLKNHPEASLGNQLLHEYLVEEDSSFSPQHEHSRQACFFSVGELTDTSLRKNNGVPLVVTVAGSAHNILRLTRPEQEKWTWHREPNVAIRLFEASKEPALWREEEGIGPILRVKCIVDLKRYNPTRWLAVQRDSGTTIFQPEYRRVQAGDSLERSVSRIAANPLFHLSKEQTGGNTHSDVSFNPATRSNLPQLAIIDERGFWSIWDVKHTKFKSSGEPTPILRINGHIDRGILEHLPYGDHSDIRWHSILWVGRSEDNLDLLGNLDLNADDEQQLGSEAAFPPLQRSSSVLVYNSQQIRLFDLITGVYLPDLEFCRHGRLDCILNVQIAYDPQYFYVLTTSKLFIVRVHSRPGVEWDKPEKLWTILFSTPHFRSPFDQTLKLAITQGHKPDSTTSLVFIYSSTNPWTDLFHVEFSPTDHNRVRCQANVTGLGSLRNTAFNSPIQALFVIPTPVIVNSLKVFTQMGYDLGEKRTKLYQILVLKSDMSLVSIMCVSSLSPPIQISVPSKNVGRRTKDRLQRASQYSPSKFIIDDDLATSEEDAPIVGNVAHRYIRAFYEHLGSVSASILENSLAVREGKCVSLYNPFDTAHKYVEDAVQTGFPPTRTLLQVMPTFKELSRHPLSAIEWENEIKRLDTIHSNVVVYTPNLLHYRLSLSIPKSLQEAYSRVLEITKKSSHHEDSNVADERRMVVVSEQIAYDLYLSLHGIGYGNPNCNKSRAAVAEDMILDSQTETLPSSPPRFESPASSAWSQRSNSEAVDDEDPAMALLRAYTGTGKFVPEKKLELLDKWQLGAEPSDYAFDLDRNSGVDAAKLRRVKQQARADRKRRRTQTLIQLSQEPELPATQPAPDTGVYSSQPKSVYPQKQTIHSDPLYTMSQPTTGAFGRRPAKKAKRKVGF